MIKKMMLCLGICCGGMEIVCKGTEGMMDIKNNRDEVNKATFCPIAINFPNFLGNSASKDLGSWAAALKNIDADVALLYRAQDCGEISYADKAIEYLSLYYFDDLIKFCNDPVCDTASRVTLFKLFSLVPSIFTFFPAISDEDEFIYGIDVMRSSNKLSRQVSSFLSGFHDKNFTVTINEKELFKQVGVAIRAFEVWREQKGLSRSEL